MANQIVLAWTVDVSNTPYSAAQALAALAAVSLYQNEGTDPILGQFFGLSVEDDQTTNPTATTATRTLTLNMYSDDDEKPAPPPFPCRPRTSTPPVLPYPLRNAVTLGGSFAPMQGSMSIATTRSQVQSLNIGDSIQLLSQIGVFYTVASVSPSAVGITAPYSGASSNNTGAFKEVVAPATLPAIFSTSPLDTNGVATIPAIPAGSGALTVLIEYTDSAGASDGVQVNLTGKRPAAVVLEPGTIDIAQIDSMSVSAVGTFGNSVGQITLVDLASALPAIPADATPEDFVRLTDEAQLLIDRHLAYMPPSYFSLAQQGASMPKLSGDFFVTTGSKGVSTSVSQVLELAAGYVLEFASQPGFFYTLETLGSAALTLTTPYSGLGANSKKTDARLIMPSSNAAAPTNAQLASPLAQFVNATVAVPPPDPPFAPGTITPPTFLSGYFTRTIQLALAGIPITSETITFLP